MSSFRARWMRLRDLFGKQLDRNIDDELATHLDLRAAGNLRKNPAFTAVAILTLAVGIVANTAIFSVFYGVLLGPLPYPNPEPIVQLEIQSLLFEVSPVDPVTFGGVALLVFLVVLLACWILARRATRVNPLTALRYE